MPTDDDFEDDRPRRPRNSRDRDDDDDRPARRRRDEDDDRDDMDDAPPRRKKGGDGLAITSMVLGIVGLVMVCCCAWVSPLLGIGALITGFMANSKGQSKGMAMAGIITGALATVGSVVLIILALTGAIQPFDPRQFKK